MLSALYTKKEKRAIGVKLKALPLNDTLKKAIYNAFHPDDLNAAKTAEANYRRGNPGANIKEEEAAIKEAAKKVIDNYDLCTGRGKKGPNRVGTADLVADKV